MTEKKVFTIFSCNHSPNKIYSYLFDDVKIVAYFFTFNYLIINFYVKQTLADKVGS